MAEKDNSLAQTLSLVAGGIAVIGGVYNFGYFAVSDLNFVMLLDYTDFLYTPVYLLLPCIGAALLVLSVRTTWRGSAAAPIIDRVASVLVVTLSLVVNVTDRQYLLSWAGDYAELIGTVFILLSFGICLLWICAEAMRLPDTGAAIVLATLGFMFSGGLYGAHVARTDLTSPRFGDRLIVKDGKSIDDVHIARLTGKGVFFTVKNATGILSFRRADAYEGIEHKTN